MTDRLRCSSRFWILVVIGILAVTIAAPAPTGAEDSVMFKYKFKEGYNQDYKIKYSGEMFFGTFGMSFFTDLEVTFKCVGVTEDSKFNMEIVFNKVDASRQRGDRMEETGMGEQLTGQTVACVVDVHGEVDDIKAMGYIEAWRQIEQEVRTVIKAFFAYMPAEEVAKGETWENTDEQSQEDLHVTSRSVYEFNEIKDEKGRQCAKVEAETEIGIGGVQTTPQGDFKAEGEGEGKTELYFDVADGIIVKMKDKMEIKMDMVPVAGGDGFEITRSYQIEVELL
jgi:hypothetical protein